MSPLTDLLWGLLVLAAALKLLTLNLWRAVLVLAPGSLRLRPEGPLEPASLPEVLTPLVGRLRSLGFVALCTHQERPLFRSASRCYDFVHPEARSFATLHVSGEQRPGFYFLTPLAPEGSVLTRERPRATPSLPGRVRSPGDGEAELTRLFSLHQERLRGLEVAEDFTPEVRLQVGRAWYQGPGRREIRRQNLQGLLWTLVALATLALLFGFHGE